MHQSKTSTLRANKKIDMVERKFLGQTVLTGFDTEYHHREINE